MNMGELTDTMISDRGQIIKEYDSICMKFKTRQNCFMVMRVREVFTQRQW